MTKRYHSFDDVKVIDKINIIDKLTVYSYSSSTTNCLKNDNKNKLEDNSFVKELSNLTKSIVFKEEVNLIGPFIQFIPIRPKCNSSFNKLSSDSINFDLDNLTYKRNNNESNNKSIVFDSSITESKYSKENNYKSNSTINKVLTTNAKTIYTRQPRSKEKEKDRFFCCVMKRTRNSKEERNKSYLSTNNTKRSTNLSLKSVILNDSLNKLRKKKEHTNKFVCTHKCIIF